MTTAADTDAHGRLVICLDDIDGFESLTARMPTPEECRNGITADTPVLVMRRRSDHTAIYRGDLTMVTIAPEPEGGRDEIRAAAEYILAVILEKLELASADLADLTRTMAQSPRNVVRMAGELKRRRAEERLLFRLAEGAANIRHSTLSAPARGGREIQEVDREANDWFAQIARLSRPGVKKR